MKAVFSGSVHLSRDMTDAEVQMRLAPLVQDGRIHIPVAVIIQGRSHLNLDAVVLETCDELVIVAYYALISFVTIGIWWKGSGRCWEELPDEVRMMVRKALRDRRMAVKEFPYEDEEWKVMEALQCEL